MIAASPTVEMSREAPSLTVIIPVYNSEAILPALIARLGPVLHKLTWRFEVILVNDGSRDASWEVISRLQREHHWLRGIDLMRNYGQHNALLCGIRAAANELIVTMDDDLQHPPEELPRLLARLAEGYDVVYGAPIQEQHGLWRNLASQATKWALQSAMGAEVAGQISAFRAFRTVLREAFANVPGPYVSIDVVLTWGTTRFAVARVAHERRQIGNSNYTFGKLLTHAMNLITGLSTLPLKVASVIGFGCLLVGMLLLVYIFGTYVIAGRDVSDLPFLASAISLFSGAQLLTLGMMGEYLARMRFGIMERPAFTVRSNSHQEAIRNGS
jgi:undecaprenyl-phosphate 4-deoxy-4-formamido-L-arabinose transferase